MSDNNTNNSGRDLKGNYYTTTFNIPIWLGDKLKDEAEEKGLRGMNRALEIICVNYFCKEEQRKENNRKVKELHERGAITENEKEILWME